MTDSPRLCAVYDIAGSLGGQLDHLPRNELVTAV
jgi:hypothetical protein